MMSKVSVRRHIKQVKRGMSNMKFQVVLLLIGVLIVGGCGTAANEVAGMTTPEREVKVLAATAQPDAAKISVSGTLQVVGAAGAVEGLAAVAIYDGVNSSTVLISGTAAADGSFSLQLPDAVPVLVFLKAKASGKTESEAVDLFTM